MEITNLSELSEVRMCDMDIGQVGVFINRYGAEIYLLCTPHCVINLEDPRYHWDRDHNCYVRILPKGTKLELEI